MGIKTYRPYTPSRRHMTGSDFSEITKTTPEKSLVVSLSKTAGRNNQGKITVPDVQELRLRVGCAPAYTMRGAVCTPQETARELAS